MGDPSNHEEILNLRLKNEVIARLVTELGKDGLIDDAVWYLVERLRKEYPKSIAAARLSEALGTEPQHELSENDLPWTLFTLNGTAYGISNRHVLSMDILSEVTHVVDAPPYCPGVTCFRDEVIELMDMRARFGLGDYLSAKSDRLKPAMMIVTNLNNVHRGFIVDEIIGVEHITRFANGVMSGKESAVASQHVKKIARREKTDEPVFILEIQSLI